MAGEKYEKIKNLLNSLVSEEIHQGLVMIREELPDISEEDARSLFEMVSVLFYIDLLDHPEHAYVLDEAVNLVRDFGEFVVPILLTNLDAGDMKAQLTIGHAFGRIGEPALGPLLESYKCEESEECRIFLVYALGKIRSPKVLEAHRGRREEPAQPGHGVPRRHQAAGRPRRAHRWGAREGRRQREGCSAGGRQDPRAASGTARVDTGAIHTEGTQ